MLDNAVLRSLHLLGVQGTYSERASVQLQYSEGFPELRHLSLYDHAGKQTFVHWFGAKSCPRLISVNLKLFDVWADAVYFPALLGQQIRLLSMREDPGVLGIGDRSDWFVKSYFLIHLLNSLTNLQHFAYCGMMSLDKILTAIPSKLQTLVVTLSALDSLQHLSEIPSNILSAKILSPSPRPNDNYSISLQQSFRRWSQSKNLDFDVMPTEWSEGYQELSVYRPAPNSQTEREGKGTVEVEVKVSKEVLEGDENQKDRKEAQFRRELMFERAEARDWFDCWEQFRIQLDC